MTRSLAILVLILAGGCAGYEEDLIVHRTGGRVWLDGRSIGRLVTEQRRELTFSACRVFDVHGEEEGGGGEEIWRVTTILPDAALSKLDYGKTPAGFAQVTPQTGRAPALRPGGEYRAECLGRRWMAVPFTVPESAPAK